MAILSSSHIRDVAAHLISMSHICRPSLHLALDLPVVDHLVMVDLVALPHVTDHPQVSAQANQLSSR